MTELLFNSINEADAIVRKLPEHKEQILSEQSVSQGSIR